MAVIEWVAVGIPIVAMVGMFGMMLKVLGGLNKRFDDLNNRFDDLKDSLDKRIDDLAVGLNKRIDDLAVEVKDMRQDVRSIDKRMVHLEGRMGWTVWKDFRGRTRERWSRCGYQAWWRALSPNRLLGRRKKRRPEQQPDSNHRRSPSRLAGTARAGASPAAGPAGAKFSARGVITSSMRRNRKWSK